MKTFPPETKIKLEPGVTSDVIAPKKELKIIFIIPFFLAVKSKPYINKQLKSIVEDMDECDFHMLSLDQMKV